MTEEKRSTEAETLATQPMPPAAVLERVLVLGDLSRLSTNERLVYYRKVCESAGLNPLTRPFDYITLNGKLTLYAKRDATDQLRKIHGVAITDLEGKAVADDLYVVTVKAKDREGRVDAATGAVSIAGLKGEAKANALMKAETKAKRRVTLSICGLGLLDETEVDTVPGAVVGEPAQANAPPDEEEFAVITPQQVKRFWAIAREHKWAEGEIKDLIGAKAFGSTKEILASEYDALIAALKARQPEGQP